MKRVCVLGNSHLAAVKLGWNQRAAAHPDLHCDFFGAPKNGMAEVAFEDGLIVPQNEAVRAAFAMTSGGRESVQLRDYDCVVAVGLGFSMATSRWWARTPSGRSAPPCSRAPPRCGSPAIWRRPAWRSA